MQVLLSFLLILMQPASAPPAAPSGGPSAPSSPPPVSAAASVPAGPTPADTETPDPQAGLTTPVRNDDDLLNLWMVRQKAVRDGDEKRADELQHELLIQRRSLGVQRLDAFAVALLREARDAVTARDDSDRAQKLVDQARQLAPGLSDIDSLQADFTLERQPWALHKWLVSSLKGLFASFSDFQRRTLLLGDLLLSGFIIFSALVVLFLVSQALRHGVGLYHGLGRAFPSVMKFLLLGIAVLVVVAPVYFGYGPVLIVFPLLILIFPSQLATEKAASALIVVSLGVTPWALRAVDRLSEAGTGATQALYALGVQATHVRAAETVSAALVERPADWQAAFALGLSQKRLGRLDSAIRSLRQAAAQVPSGTPDAAWVANNLANALFATGRTESAEKLYLQAIADAPRAPEPHFNLARLHTRKTRLEKAREHFAQASALNPDRVAQWNDDLDLNLNRFVVDMDLSTDALTRRELSMLLSPSPLATQAWHRLAGPVPELAAPISALATLLVFGLMIALRKRTHIVVPCSRCAMAAQIQLGAAETAPLCEQCHNLFIRNIPVDRRIRFEKEERIARFRAFRQWGLRLAAVIMPGLPSFLEGRPIRGALVAGLVTLLGLRLVLPDGVLFEPFEGAPVPANHDLVILSLIGLIWLIGLVRTYRDTRELA